MGNFEEAYLEQPEIKSVRFSVQLKLEKNELDEIVNGEEPHIGDILLNQMVAAPVEVPLPVADEYVIRPYGGRKYRVAVVSTRHYDNGVIVANCSATLAAEEEDPEELAGPYCNAYPPED